MVGSESNPYVKTGGLADVIYALSVEMAKTGEEVSVILPLYNDVRRKLTNAKKVAECVVYLSWRREVTNIYKEEKNGVSFYFV